MNHTGMLTQRNLHQIINNSESASAIIFQTGRIAYFNERFVELFKFSPENTPTNFKTLLK